MDGVKYCLEGAFDLHVHTAPDVMERKLDDIDLARMMRDKNMGGFVIKSHHSTTYGRAKLTSKIVQGVKVYGSIALNNPLGGLNPQAVDTAGRMGAKVIWLPTIDAINEEGKFLNKDTSKLPYWAAIQKELYEKNCLKPPVNLKDSSGHFKHEVGEILDFIKDYNMILATGHLHPNEGMELIEYARQNGVNRIIATHPEFPTTKYTIDQQKELASKGVYLERCYTTPATNKVDWDYLYKEVEETGARHNILSTDLGQPQALYPTEGLERFIGYFLKTGLTEEEVKKMTTENQLKLLEG